MPSNFDIITATAGTPRFQPLGSQIAARRFGCTVAIWHAPGLPQIIIQ